MGSFIWVVVGIFAFFALGTVLLFLFLPKLAKYVSKQAIDIEKEVMTDKEEDLKYVINKRAEISKDAITKTTRAIKEGLKGSEIYCKHCGAQIDADSAFCKKCGKQQ